MNYWQVGCGSFGRDYADKFIAYGMAFVGGEFSGTMEKLKVGDRVLMKRGMTEVVAAGQVVERDGKHKGVGDKEWLCDFDGWDLRAYCFVQWHVPKEPIKTKGLTRATIQKVHQEKNKQMAERVLETVPASLRRDPEPRATRKVEDNEILEFLIRRGLRPGAAEDLTATLSRIRLLARYYYDQGYWENIREHETRTFLVIPLLLALGWAEQHVKIELPVKDRRRADVACFSKPYTRKNKDCVLIVETKGFSQGLDYGPEQVKAYAKNFPLCQAVVVSNGYCYKAYKRDDRGSFPDKPSAYLNLLSPRDRYPLDPDNVEGSLEVLRLLLPQSWR